MKENGNAENGTGMCTEYKIFDLEINEKLFT